MDTLIIHDLKFGLSERWCHLVLYHLDPGFIAHHLVAILDRTDATDIQSHRRVKLERITAGGGFRRAKYHPDLHADLVDEDHQGVRVLDIGSHLAQGLGHQPGLQPHVMISHVPFDLGSGGQGGDRVDYHYIHRAGTHHHVADLQRLFAGIWLAHQQVVYIDSQLFGIDGIKRVLCIDEGAGAADLLGFGDDLQG